MKKILIFILIFIFCGPSESEIQERIDTAVDEAISITTTAKEEQVTTTSSSTTTIYEEIDVCLQYVKEVNDVYVEFQLTTYPMEERVDDWYEGDKTSFESAGVARSLNIVKNNALTRLNAKVNNLIPDTKNSLNYKKWLQITENTNTAMELLIYGFENLDFDLISQGDSLITVVNRDFDLLPNIYNCEN